MNTANPIIHLNGNSGGRLLDGYQTALDALDLAISEFSAIEFHQRDYYPVPGSWEIARAERTASYTKLTEVKASLERIRDSIHAQTHRE